MVTQTVKSSSNRNQWHIQFLHHLHYQSLLEPTGLTDTEKEVGFDKNAINFPFDTFSKCQPILVSAKCPVTILTPVIVEPSVEVGYRVPLVYLGLKQLLFYLLYLAC